jgi:hypothetical protein
VQAAGSKVTVLASADATVKLASPTTNYGAKATLITGTNVKSFLSFAVGTAPSGTGKLKLWVTKASTKAVHALQDANCWQESTITWDNAPDLVGAPKLGKAVPSTTGAWLTVPISSFYPLANGIYRFALTSSAKASFASREVDSAHAPRLVYTPPPTAGAVPGLNGAASPQGASPTPPSRPGRLPGPPRVLAMGDSLTECYCDPVVARLVGDGYDVLDSPSSGKGLLDANPDLVATMQRYVSEFDPDYVVAEELGNYTQSTSIDPSIEIDTPEYYAAWRSRADALTSAAKVMGALMWWLDNPPVTQPNFYGDHVNDRMEELTTLYHSLAASHPGLGFIDAWTPFGGLNLDPSLRQPDGVHFNSVGAQVMSDLVASVVEGLPSAPTAPTVTGSSDGSAVTLSWDATGERYLVERSDVADDLYLVVGETTDPSFTDSAVTAGATYHYAVRAIASGVSTASADVAVDIVAPS